MTKFPILITSYDEGYLEKVERHAREGKCVVLDYPREYRGKYYLCELRDKYIFYRWSSMPSGIEIPKSFDSMLIRYASVPMKVRIKTMDLPSVNHPVIDKIKELRAVLELLGE